MLVIEQSLNNVRRHAKLGKIGREGAAQIERIYES